MSNKDLSIVIRCLDRLEYTVRTIVSIGENSGLNRSDYEIICVDQGSTDGTIDWLLSINRDNYYPVVPIFLEDNIGDGRGMQIGIESARGEFIAQHDSDIELVTPNYYQRLISIYKSLEENDHQICALGGSHKQGINENSAPFKFAKKRDPLNKFNFLTERVNLISTAWCTASFIFKNKFTEVKFDKRACNAWCGEWFDRGYENFVCEEIKFYHIDSAETGAEVQKQYDKFPNYEYIFSHYKNFIETNKK